MEWIVETGDAALQTLAWLGGLGLAFALLSRLMPCNPGMYWWTNPGAALTDLLYWFVIPLILRVGRTYLLAAGVALFFGRRPGFLELAMLPLWQQCILVLVIQDVMLYWIHRLFHTNWGWRFHAVHHSPRVLDWMSSARFHVVNNLLAFVLADVAMLLLGFSWEALIALAPVNLIYSTMVHANLNWTFGPLRFIFASPVFHRWHHAAEGEGMNKNFAPTFPLLDLIFGTFYMPAGQLPQNFGNGEHDYPEDFFGQFLQPFLPRRKAAPVVETSENKAA